MEYIKYYSMFAKIPAVTTSYRSYGEVFLNQARAGRSARLVS